MILRVFIVIQLLLGISNCFSIDPYAHILESETTIQQYFTTFDGVPEGSGLKYVDCVYVLNLARRPEKWANTVNQLSPYKIPFNRFEGIYGWGMGEAEITQFWSEQQRFLPEGHDINSATIKNSPGKLGCVLSHLSLIQDAYDRGYQCIWLLQDDIEVVDDLHKIDEK